MRPLWIILGLFLASIVYGTLIWWPEKPMWTAHYSRFSHVLGFNEDSTSIFVLDNLGNGDDSPFTPNLSQLDAITGKLLREIPIKFHNAEFKDPVEYTLSGDGKTLIVMEPISYLFYVFDTATAQQRLGPIHCWWRQGNTEFSRDGRWIVYHFQSKKDPLDDGGVEVIDSKTGKAFLRVAQSEHISIRSTCFSPDGSSIALLQRKQTTPEGVDDFSIRIFNLPGGNEQIHFALAKRRWIWTLDKWEDHYLSAFAWVPGPNKGEFIGKLFSIDLKSVPIGEETERFELAKWHDAKKDLPWKESLSGSGWRAEIEYGASEQDLIWKCWKKCAEWIGLKRKAAWDEMEIRLRFHDSDTTRTRYESPVFTDSTPDIATNGASYAMMTYGGDLSVWDANPFPRWPWALAASLGTLLLILLLGRWRYKRTRVASLVSCPQA